MSKQDELMVNFLDTADSQYKDFIRQVNDFFYSKIIVSIMLS